MKKFTFLRGCTEEEANYLSLLIGNRKGNTLTIHHGDITVYGCVVADQDADDVYRWGLKRGLLE